MVLGRWHTLGGLCWYLDEFFKSKMSSWNDHLAKDALSALYNTTTHSRMSGNMVTDFNLRKACKLQQL